MLLRTSIDGPCTCDAAAVVAEVEEVGAIFRQHARVRCAHEAGYDE
jgi:hypothetical protein